MLLWLLHLCPARATPNTLLPHFQKECSVSENIDVLSSVPSVDAPGPGMTLCLVAWCSQPLQAMETWAFLPLLMNLPATLSSWSSRKNLCRSWMVGSPTPGAQIVWLCLLLPGSPQVLVHSIVVVQSLSLVWLFATAWTVARQASFSFIISQVCSNSYPLSQWCH